MRSAGTAESKTSESGFATGRGLHSTASSAVKIAVVAPMPSASESTAVITNPGLRRQVRSV